MNSLLQSLIDHRAWFAKVVAACFVAGMLGARIPSSGDLDRITANLVKLLNEQRMQLERHEIEIAARLTRADVRDMVQGSDNPWTLAASLVMPTILRYDEDREKTRAEIGALWRAVGSRRSGSQ